MATSTYLHGVQPSDVLDVLPADTRYVTADSAGLNLGQIAGYIERGAGQVNALLVRQGMTPEALDANSAQVARDAILTYAAQYSLERLGAGADQIDRREREWQRLTKLLKEDPQSMGAAQDEAGTLGVKSNLPTTRTERRWGTHATRRY